jgi:hypothetical protein
MDEKYKNVNKICKAENRIITFIMVVSKGLVKGLVYAERGQFTTI